MALPTLSPTFPSERLACKWGRSHRVHRHAPGPEDEEREPQGNLIYGSTALRSGPRCSAHILVNPSQGGEIGILPGFLVEQVRCSISNVCHEAGRVVCISLFLV